MTCSLFARRVWQNILGLESLFAQGPRVSVDIPEEGNAQVLPANYEGRVDLMVTSPPYVNAINFYWGYHLEME